MDGTVMTNPTDMAGECVAVGMCGWARSWRLASGSERGGEAADSNVSTQRRLGRVGGRVAVQLPSPCSCLNPPHPIAMLTV